MSGRKIVKSALDGTRLTAKKGKADGIRYVKDVKKHGVTDWEHHMDIMNTVHNYPKSTYYRAFGKVWNAHVRQSKKDAAARAKKAKGAHTRKITAGAGKSVLKMHINAKI